MTIVKGRVKTLSLNVQRDYITLRTPNGNYTTKWSGATGSGKLGMDNKAFNAIDNYVETQRKVKPLMDVMKELLTAKVMNKLWKNWNEAVPVNDFKAGEDVLFISGSLFAKKYPKGGSVVKVARKNVFIKLNNTGEVCGFNFQTMKRKYSLRRHWCRSQSSANG